MDWVRFTVSEQSQSPKAPGQSGDRLGHTGTGGLAGWRRCNCQTQETPCLGQWEAGTWPPAPFKRSENARTGVPYQSTRVPGCHGTHKYSYRNPSYIEDGLYVPIPDIMPQTGGQRAFHQVHPGPLRFHPPTPKLPERPLIAAYCPVRCQAQRRGEWEGRYMVPYRILYCRPSPSLALAHGPCPCSWAGGSSTQQQGTQGKQQSAAAHLIVQERNKESQVPASPGRPLLLVQDHLAYQTLHITDSTVLGTPVFCSSSAT